MALEEHGVNNTADSSEAKEAEIRKQYFDSIRIIAEETRKFVDDRVNFFRSIYGLGSNGPSIGVNPRTEATQISTVTSLANGSITQEELNFIKSPTCVKKRTDNYSQYLHAWLKYLYNEDGQPDNNGYKYGSLKNGGLPRDLYVDILSDEFSNMFDMQPTGNRQTNGIYHFMRRDFAYALMQLCNNVKGKIGISKLPITSLIRTPAYNRALYDGTKCTSAHNIGIAADVGISNPKQRKIIADTAYHLGFSNIYYMDSAVHIDLLPFNGWFQEPGCSEVYRGP